MTFNYILCMYVMAIRIVITIYIRSIIIIIFTSREPVEGKSPVCLICMKYRIIFKN